MSDDSIGKVRIENLDDISIFDYEGRIKKLEQVKYKSPCNLTDYSKDLWNTLYNWLCIIENINKDNIRSNIKFAIYSWGKCEIGNLANDFLNIKNKDNFDEIWKKQEEYFKEKDNDNEIKQYFNKLNTNKELLKFILNSFYIEQPIKSSSEDFIDMLTNKYGETFKPINNFNVYIKGCFGIDLENQKLKTEKIIEITRQQFDFYKDRYDRLSAYDLVDSFSIETKKIENLKDEELFEQYRQTDLEAVKEVNTSLCIIKHDSVVENQTKEKLSLETKNLNDAQKMLNRGVVSKTQYINYENSYTNKNMEYTKAKTQRLVNYYTLYKTVGGKI